MLNQLREAGRIFAALPAPALLAASLSPDQGSGPTA